MPDSTAAQPVKAAKPRLAFVTIGQSPRVDLMPEILAEADRDIEAVEHGLLDGMSEAELAAMAPDEGEGALCTRLADGREIVTGKRKTEAGLHTLLQRLDGEGYAAIVLLCTGHFHHTPGRTLLIEAQRVVDASVEAFRASGTHLGVVLPLERQQAEFHMQDDAARRMSATHWSPYSEANKASGADAAGSDRLSAAAADMAGCDLVVMHCMGYTEAMRQRMADATHKPVLLARRIVAGAIRQIV